MKKLLYMLPIFILLLTGCVADESSTHVKINNPVDAFGDYIVHFDKDVNKFANNGPIKIQVKNVKVMDLHTNDEYSEIMKYGRDTHIILMQVDLMNMSGIDLEMDVIGTELVTNKGEQAKAAYFNAIGGTLLAKTKTSGELYFEYKNSVKDLTNLKWYIGSTYNKEKNYYLNEGIEINIPLK